MAEYVNEFLRALRADFPRVIVGNVGGPEVVAEARRMPGGGWDGNLSLFLPKRAGGIFFNQTWQMLLGLEVTEAPAKERWLLATDHICSCSRSQHYTS
ncbi:hypothetical protein BFJ68_g13275 [Fusarium oxysporum]|uniref:Uncharacterized protein n=1 Tax=Fusarium oxysporum TaxID=5507 RepID=A0A420Q3S4_FUSOX|nr:hypothetical protein BFJ68_g13275 [Fusarium oxysporum]